MKKIIKSMTALLLCMVFLCACGAQTTENVGNADPTSPTNSIENSPVSAGDYYRYLNDVFIPKEQLASVNQIAVKVPHSLDIHRAGGTGLASVLIDDFNGDGVLEMLTVEVEDISIMDTFWNKVYFEDGAPYDSEKRCLRLLLRHYIYENDQIVENGIGVVNMLHGVCWGKIVLGVEKIGGDFYLFSKMTSANIMTYGPSMYTVTRISGNSLSPDYTAPIQFGRADRSNYLDLMGLQNSIRPDTLSLSDLTIPSYTASVSEIRQALGNRLLCVVDVDSPNGTEDLTYQLTDYTHLRENLKDNGANWERIPLPEGYTITLSEDPSGVADLISRLETATGSSFICDHVNEEGDIYDVTFTSETGNQLMITFNTASDKLISIGLIGTSSKPDEEWYRIKDALLQNEFGLTADEQSTLLGDQVSWMDYVNGITLGQYQFRVFAITNATFRATLAE